MRKAIFGMSVALILTGVALLAATQKPLPVDVGPGRIAWFDLTTTDIVRAKEFYSKLLGWTYDPIVGTDQVVEIVAGGTGIGTLRVAEGQISPFNGVVYVQVEDLAGSCAKAKELGATIVPGFPFNLSDGRGAIGVLIDPTGHPLGLYSRTPLPPAPAPGS